MRSIIRFSRRVLLIALLVMLVLIGYLGFKTPSNDADWQTAVKVLPTVELQDDLISIKNVRDFRYNADQTIADIRYFDQSYELSQFKNAWYGISHFGDNGMAHVFLSFEFGGDTDRKSSVAQISDSKYLVMSIEARLQNKDVDGYHPLKGLFRAYTKTIVLATEQDVIGLRTHVRDEPVNLYRLELSQLYSKALLLNFLREAQILNSKPSFYNTFIDNCMTGLLAQSDQFRNIRAWLDMRILLPGNSDELAYELGYIDSSRPFDEVRARALIDPKITSIDDADFSLKIRM